MKASPVDQEQLLLVQATDTRLGRIDHLLHSSPHAAELAQLQEHFADTSARVREVLGELDDVRAEVKRLESDVNVVEGRIKRDTDRLLSTSSAKDVAALEAELQALARRHSELEDSELAAMERVSECEESLRQAQAQHEESTQRLTALEHEQADESNRLRAESDALLRDRAALIARIPADLLALYDKQRSRYGIGAARLHRGVSMGSNVTLTESDLGEIRLAADDDVVLCPDSGAILIRDAESGL